MPISVDEETINYYASIPIKKRKFPMFRPSSPPPHEQSSPPVKSLKNDLPSPLPNEQSSLPVKSVTNDLPEEKSVSVCQESSLLNAGVGTCSLWKSHVNKNLVLEIKKEVSTDTNCNLVRCSADVCSSKNQVSLNTVDCQERLLLFADQKMEGIPKVDSAPNEAPAIQVKKEIVNELQDSCIPEVLRTPRTVQLLLGPKDPLVPAFMVGQSSGDFNQEPDKLYNTSLCLSINHDNCADLYKSGDVKSNVSSPVVHADRSNWDLNTTMDAWQGTTADVAAPEIVPISVLKNSADLNGVEPTISAVLGSVPDTEQQFVGETDTVSNFAMSSFPASGQDRSDDSLYLGLSAVMPNFNAEHLTSLADVVSESAPLNTNMVEGLVCGGNSSSVGYDLIKSEPYVESSKHDSLGDRCNTMGLSDFVDKELVERCSSKAVSSSVVKPDEAIGPRTIKSELTQSIQETQVMSCVPPKKFIQQHDNASSVCPSGLLTCPANLTSGDAPDEVEVSTCKEEVHVKSNTTQGNCEPTQSIQETHVTSCVPPEKFVQQHDNVSSVSSVCASGLLTCPAKLTSGDAPNEVEVSTCKEEVHVKSNTTQGNCEPTQSIQETHVMSCVPPEKFVQQHDNVSSVSSVCASGLLTCPAKLTSGDAPNEVEVSTCKEEVHVKTNTRQGNCELVEHVTTDIGYSSMSHEINELKAVEDMVCSSGPENAMGHGPLNSCGDAEESGSGQKNIKTSADMLEEDSYGSDCKAENNDDIICSDGIHDVSKDKKYEHEYTVAEVPVGKRDKEKHIQDAYDGNISLSYDFPDNCNTYQAPYSSYGNIEDQGETSDDHIKECVDPAKETSQITGRDSYLQETDRIIDKDSPLQEIGRTINRDSSFQESSTIEESEAIKMPITVTQDNTFDISGRSVVQMDHDLVELSDGAINGGHSMDTNISEIKNVLIQGTNNMGKVDSTLLKTESSTVSDVANDSSSGGKRSRIINLRQASDVASPSMPRYVTDRSLVSTRRERYADEDEKVYQQRKRVECYDDGPRRFERVRFQAQPFRDSRINHVRGRGRGRGFRQRGEWDFDRNFGGDVCNGADEYRVRRKHVSSVGNAEVEDEGYRIGLGMGRGGRKPTSDVLPSFCRPSSRRFPTGVEDTSGTRGVQTVRRFPGNNIFSRRRTGENVSDLAGFRHEEDFTRDFPDDFTGPIFNRPRPTYQRFDGRFPARGNRNFSSIQRRGGLPRIRSKSPVRFEAHSNRPWLSPQRESPEGLNELQELPEHRSATTYRMEMRISPGSPCFPAERVSRRRGSPPYVSRPSHNFMDVESGRSDLPRSASPDGRSPSNRIIPMNNRRLNIEDPHERTGSDELGDSNCSGRFVGTDRKGDERRKGGDRYGNRSFCPPFNADDRGNLHSNSEEGSRPVRFRTEAGSEFIERGNLRKRDFERRIKNISGIAQGRMRNLEEEDANYRHDKHVWHDHGFDDTSRMKRRY